MAHLKNPQTNEILIHLYEQAYLKGSYVIEDTNDLGGLARTSQLFTRFRSLRRWVVGNKIKYYSTWRLLQKVKLCMDEPYRLVLRRKLEEEDAVLALVERTPELLERFHPKEEGSPQSVLKELIGDDPSGG